MTSEQPTVTALILTYGSPETLRMVLRAISDQSVPVSEILVIDNAGEPPAEAVAHSIDERIRVVRTPRNEGPAGGWFLALGWFLRSSTSNWAWMLDDDAVPTREALEVLLRAADAKQVSVVRPIVLDHQTGAVRRHPSWCGPLVRREAIEACGLPLAELVWWAEDTEYFQVRLPGAGYHEFIEEKAKVIHYGLRRHVPRSPAKIYYEVRNRLWIKIYAKGQLRRPMRWWKIARAVALGAVHVVRSESRMEAFRAAALGVLDGVKGRLGYRFTL